MQVPELVSPFNPFVHTDLETLLTERYFGDDAGNEDEDDELPIHSPPLSGNDPSELYNLSEHHLRLNLADFEKRLSAALTGFQLNNGTVTVPFEPHIFRASVCIARCAMGDLGVKPAGGLVVPFVAITLYTMAKPYRLYGAVNQSMKKFLLKGEVEEYRRFKFFLDNLMFGLLQLPCPNPLTYFRGNKFKHKILWGVYLTEPERLHERRHRQFVAFTSTSDNYDVGFHYMQKRSIAHNHPISTALDRNFPEARGSWYKTLFEMNVSTASDVGFDPKTHGFKEISAFSWFPNESEILFFPGTVFVLESAEAKPTPDARGENGWVHMKVRVVGQSYRVTVPESLRPEVAMYNDAVISDVEFDV